MTAKSQERILSIFTALVILIAVGCGTADISVRLEEKTAATREAVTGFRWQVIVVSLNIFVAVWNAHHAKQIQSMRFAKTRAQPDETSPNLGVCRPSISYCGLHWFERLAKGAR